MRTIALLSLCLSAAVAAADPPKVPEAPVAARPGEVVTFTVAGKDACWCPAFEANRCTLVRLHSDDPDTLTFLAQPREAGTFPVVCWTKGEAKGVVLRIVAANPEPPKPPPAPDSPLRQKLKAAYEADAMAAESKAKARADLVELYRQASKLAADESVTTTGELLDRVRRAAQVLAPDQLVPVRRVIAAELAAGLGGADVSLTPELRAAAAALFGRIADALAW